MTLIKICGITNKVDAVKAASLGADMVGFVFYPKSKRYIKPEDAADIIKELPASVVKVGVFVDADKDMVRSVVRLAGLRAVQFHGGETPSYCQTFAGYCKIIKAFRIKGSEGLKDVNNFKVDFILLDTFKDGLPGGTGEVFDWNIINGVKFSSPIILSGGLTADNVSEAIIKTSPYAVDVSSGVEDSPGIKNAVLMKRFIEKVRKV